MSEEENRAIATFAILDVEVNAYKEEQFNKCSLTELCVYAISTKCCTNDIKINGRVTKKLPELPRVLHKLNLMINPLSRIHDHTRTGLNNYMLEEESPFDADTADVLDKFLKRLPKPVCLVAHNGLTHDFPLVRHVYDKLRRTFTSPIYCIDSLDAFRQIDTQIESLKINKNVTVHDRDAMENPSSNSQLQENNESTLHEDTNNSLLCNVNRQKNNESTPIKKSNQGAIPKPTKVKAKENYNNHIHKVKRNLFQQEHSYKLGKLFEEVFEGNKCGVLHMAEADVKILTLLILHYGKDFVKYAEDNKQTFDKVAMLGAYVD